MTTYADFSTRLLTALGDPDGTSTSADLVYHAVCGALDAILPWCAPHLVTTLTSDGVNMGYTLPDGIYRIDGVQDVDSLQFMERVMINPSNRVRPGLFQWIEWPQGTLNLTETLSQGRQLNVYYSGYWTKPANADDSAFVLTVPQFVEMGMVFWAASYVMVPASLGTSQVRQYNQRIDSGSPIDNPIEQSAKFLRALFMDEMNRLPKAVGGSS